jgi:uncharacterized membrane protein YkvI
MWSLRRWSLVLRISFVYAGTAVGAGFASGQEIMQFFTSHGKDSIWAVLFAVGMFSWLGVRMLLLGSRLGTPSYEDFNCYLFGEYWGKWMSRLVSLMLFGITTAMLSGSGALFEEQLGLSFHLGVLATIFIAYVVILRGMDGILSVNSLVVPMMLLFIGMVALHTWKTADWSSYMPFPLGPSRYHWLVPSLIYVAYNLSLMQAVLIPLGAKVADEPVVMAGGLLGGLGLGLMLFASNLAMQIYWTDVSHLKIPMAFVISRLGAGLKYFFLLVMWAEILTTLIGNVYGLTVSLKPWIPYRPATVMAVIFGLGYLFSLFGFPVLIGFLYPFFGYAGLMTLIRLALCRLPA